MQLDRRRNAAWSAVALTLFSAPAAAQDQQQALDQVRDRIEQLEERLSQQALARDAQARELRQTELAIRDAQQALEQIRAQLAAQNATLDEIAADTRLSREKLALDSDILHQQIRLSHRLGRAEFLKLLLSQESPADFGRMVGYYDYLNRARSERIQNVRREVDTLNGLLESTRVIQDELIRLEAAQAAELEQLSATRAVRRALVSDLESSMQESGAEIDKLRAEEQRLADLLVELGDILAAFPAGSEAPFATLKGRLAWPVSGRIIGDYGRPRDGGPIRWNGVVLAGDAGTPVRAVYHGRVAFSDWLTGLGLLLIVDHGDGYLSLYGYNEVLLKESGDWVEPGEVLARVGDTGGRPEPALYFALRRDGKPIDPHEWMNGDP